MAIQITPIVWGDNYYNVNIDGVDYVYTPQEFVEKGNLRNGTQWVEDEFLNPGVFDNAFKFTLPTTEGLTDRFQNLYGNPKQGYLWAKDSLPFDLSLRSYKVDSNVPAISGMTKDPNGTIVYATGGASAGNGTYLYPAPAGTSWQAPPPAQTWTTTQGSGPFGGFLGGLLNSLSGGVSDLFSGVSDFVHDVGESPIAQALAVYAAGAALGPAGAAAASGAIAKDQGATDEQALTNAALTYAVASAKEAMAAPTEPAPVVDSSPPVPATGVEVNPVPTPNVTGVDLGPATGTLDAATQAALDAAARNLAATAVPAPTPTGVEVNPVPLPNVTGVDLGPAVGTVDPATQAALDAAARGLTTAPVPTPTPTPTPDTTTIYGQGEGAFPGVTPDQVALDQTFQTMQATLNPTLWDSLKAGWNDLPDVAKNVITNLGTGALLSTFAPQQEDSGTGYQPINWSWSPISAPTAEQATSQVVPSSFTLPDLLTETITRTPYSMQGQITDPTVSLAQDIIGRPITYAPLVQPVKG